MHRLKMRLFLLFDDAAGDYARPACLTLPQESAFNDDMTSRILLVTKLAILAGACASVVVGCSDVSGAGGTAGRGGVSGMGGNGGDGASGGMGGIGGMTSCELPAECDDDNDCTEDSCNADLGRCSHPGLPDGTLCAGGSCEGGECRALANVFPCTENGIRAAIALGGESGFDCDGPTTVETGEEIVVNDDVLLDGQGNLTVSAGGNHRVFRITQGAVAELRRLGVTARNGLSSAGGIRNDGMLTLNLVDVAGSSASSGAGIENRGALALVDSLVTDNSASEAGGGVLNSGTTATLDLLRTTVSDNRASFGGGIWSERPLTIINSTIANNAATGSSGGGLYVKGGTVEMLHATISGNSAVDGADAMAIFLGSVEARSTIIDGDCAADTVSSLGYNIERLPSTCGLSDATDQEVMAVLLGSLRDNGGPTPTMAPLAGSPAREAIPTTTCDLGRDQRGVARPQGMGCEVGSVELE